MSELALKIFLCHSAMDKAVVRKLYGCLKDDGFEPWLDEKDLLPGQDWQEIIPAAVRASHVVLVCLSKNSITKEGYVQKEIKLALDIADEKPEGTIFIIPVRIEEVEIPRRLAQWQYASLFQENGYQKLLFSLQLRSHTLGMPIHAGKVSLCKLYEQASQGQPIGEQLWRDEHEVTEKLGPKQIKVFQRSKLWMAGFVFLMVMVLPLYLKWSHSKQQTQETDFPTTAQGMNEIAQRYASRQDYPMAKQWYEKAANAGSLSAMYSLGIIYQAGLGVEKDYQQARQWHEKAAAGGNEKAMLALSLIYEQGLGVPVDEDRARYWRKKAEALQEVGNEKN